MTRALLIVVFALGAFAPAAHAGFIPAVTVDGPSADVVSAGDVDLARDGGGAVTYLKSEGGVAHVFVSTLTLGAPGPVLRLDAGQLGASSQPRVGVSSAGRVLVVWVNDGRLYASLRPGTLGQFSPPVEVTGAVGMQDPSLSMTINGKAYATYTTSAGDVRASYMAIDGSWFSPDAPLDLDPARAAGSSAVAASGDGSALLAWTEVADGVSHVFARRMVGARLGSVTREVSVGSFETRPGANADSPSVGIEYDSSYAWVAFRQDFSNGTGTVSRTLTRRLVASEFDPPKAIDGGEPSDHPRIAFTGRGRGTFAASVAAPGGVVGTLLKNDVFEPSARLDAGNVFASSYPVPTAADDGTGTVSWQRDSSIVARRLSPKLNDPEALLSVPEFGPAEASAGLEAAADRAGNAAITFAQGDPGARRVVVALYDLAPRAPAAHNDEKWRRETRPKFHWASVTDAWSTTPVRFRLEIDHVAVKTLTGTTYRLPAALPDGDHRWRIVTSDARGQESIGIDRFLRIDTRRPTISVRLSGRARRGAPTRFTASVSDPPSGVASVALDFGDGSHGTAPVKGGKPARIAHVFRVGGTRLVRATAVDRAGNTRVATLRVRVR